MDRRDVCPCRGFRQNGPRHRGEIDWILGKIQGLSDEELGERLRSSREAWKAEAEKRQTERAEGLSAIEAQRAAALKAIDDKYGATLKALQDEKDASDKARQAGYDADRKALDDKLATARREYDAAVAAAEGTGEQAGEYEAEDHSYLKQPGGEQQPGDGSVQGTFSAFEASRMGTDTVASRTAIATEETARNTRLFRGANQAVVALRTRPAAPAMVQNAVAVAAVPANQAAIVAPVAPSGGGLDQKLAERIAKATEEAVPLAKKQLPLTQRLAMPVWGS